MRTPLLVALVLVLHLAACGDDQPGTATAAPTSAPEVDDTAEPQVEVLDVEGEVIFLAPGGADYELVEKGMCLPLETDFTTGLESKITLVVGDVVITIDELDDVRVDEHYVRRESGEHDPHLLEILRIRTGRIRFGVYRGAPSRGGKPRCPSVGTAVRG